MAILAASYFMINLPEKPGELGTSLPRAMLTGLFFVITRISISGASFGN